MNSLMSQDLEPPKDLFVEIRVLSDCGEIVTSDGNIIHLEQNTTHLLRRADVKVDHNFLIIRLSL